MATHDRQILREIRFTGGRFEETEGWLDLDVLAELLNYKEILIAIVREIWLREHQGSERLPRGFAQEFHLAISEIGTGPYSVQIESIVTGTLPGQTERLHKAAALIDTTLMAAQDTEPFPKEITDAVLTMFKKWGRSLKTNESLVLSGNNSGSPILNSAIRKEMVFRTSVIGAPPSVGVTATPYRSTADSILEMFDDIRKSTPAPDGYAPPPSDLAKNLKHYLYGSPKENA